MKTILVIDDNADIRGLVVATLEMEGYRVLVADGGAEGMSIADAERPDLVVLDLAMPDVDGAEVARRMQQEHREIPIILMSAYPDVAKVASTLGAVGYLHKPFLASTLWNAVARALSPG